MSLFSKTNTSQFVITIEVVPPEETETSTNEPIKERPKGYFGLLHDKGEDCGCQFRVDNYVVNMNAH